jgi:hypothetical protein
MIKKPITAAALMLLAASGARADDELAPALCKLAELPASCTLNPAYFDDWNMIVDYVVKTHDFFAVEGRPDDRTLQEYDAARAASVKIRAELRKAIARDKARAKTDADRRAAKNSELILDALNSKTPDCQPAMLRGVFVAQFDDILHGRQLPSGYWNVHATCGMPMMSHAYSVLPDVELEGVCQGKSARECRAVLAEGLGVISYSLQP